MMLIVLRVHLSIEQQQRGMHDVRVCLCAYPFRERELKHQAKRKKGLEVKMQT